MECFLKFLEVERIVATRGGIEPDHVAGGGSWRVDEVDVELVTEASGDEEEVVTKIVDEDHWKQG